MAKTKVKDSKEKKSQFALLPDRRFWPLFITQFLGAFNDNLFKYALIALLLYTSVINAQMDVPVLINIASGVFILPFVLFSALGGQFADKFEKQLVMQRVKIAEIGIVALGVVALMTGSLAICMATLFALGVQSAFFGPCKYSFLPQHLKEDELVGGNALLNTGSFLAILLGMIGGTVLVTLHGGRVVVSIVLIAAAIAGYLASRKLVKTKPAVPDLKVNYNVVSEVFSIVRTATSQGRGITLAILGVAWFYFLGALYMAQFPSLVKVSMGGDSNVVAFFLILFSIGIAVGGLFNDRLLRGRVEAIYVPVAALGISLFSIDMYFAAGRFMPVVDTTLMSLPGFLSDPKNIRITFDALMIALCCGFYVVPLNALIQHHTPEKVRARVLAGNAIINAGFIVASSVLAAVLLIAGLEIRSLFFIFALVNLVVALYICRLLPAFLLKSILQTILKIVYRVEVKGLENFDGIGRRAVIVANHTSMLDAPVLAAFLPGKPMFAVGTNVSEWWWVKPWAKFVNFFPMDPTNPMSMKGLIRRVQEDEHCVIFPEGRLTETGGLMKVYEGPAMVADKADAVLVPVRIDGVQHTPFARLKGKVARRLFPKITMTVLPPQKIEMADELKGRSRRAEAGRLLYDTMETMMFETSNPNLTLFSALLDARRVNGGKTIIAEDIERKPINYKKVVKGSTVLGHHFAQLSEKGDVVGVLLPNSLGGIISFCGLQQYGRVPALLNFSAGEKALTSACKTAKIKVVLTSKLFIKKGRLEDLIAALGRECEIVYLEDIRKRLGFSDLIRGFLSPFTAGFVHRSHKVDPHDPAVILFTSGSEGMPKGVVLSHVNLMSNIHQLSCRIDFNREDIVFNCLPMFHAFGLTGGTLLPLLSGVKIFMYPSPLHYRIVPELIYFSNATIMFGTDTFLTGYARMASAYDFYKMRYIFAGAEKVKEETRQVYMSRFGTMILEGYGATETAPALAVNSAMHNKGGTVGRFLAGIDYKLVDVPGVDDGKRLYVRGPNIMMGYYLADNPGELVPLDEDGYYDTGDIVSIDGHGYITIKGRAKRFAKIAGEMVSLTSVETMVAAIYPDFAHAVVSIPDQRKGEQLILLTTNKDAVREDLSSYASDNGITELAVPKTIIIVDDIPVLGSGKTDYVSVKDIAEEQILGKKS